MMDRTLLEKELYSICRGLRNIFDQCVIAHPDLFKSFPKGFCNHVSIWTYDYLYSLGYKNINFCASDNFLFSNKHYCHIWLNYQGIDIDLTCDQYNSTESKYDSVIVSATNVLYKDVLYRPSRQEQVELEYYNPMRDMIFPNAHRERDIIYNAMGLVFKLNIL